MHILLARIGMRGDTFFSVPALKNIRTAYPEATLHCIVSPLGLDVVNLYPGLVDHCYVYDPYRKKASQNRLAKALASYSFSMFFNFDTSLEFHQFYCDTFSFDDYFRMVTQQDKHPSKQVVQTMQDPVIHISDRYNKLVALANIPSICTSYSMDVIPSSIQEYGASFRKKHHLSDQTKLIGFHPGNHQLNTNTLFQKIGFNPRAWPLAYFKGLGIQLTDNFKEMAIVVTGGFYERKVTRQLVKSLRQLGIPVIHAADKLPFFFSGAFHRFLGLISALDLMVSGDTGPMHMAAALKRPVLGLFMYTDPRDTGPKGDPELSTIVQATTLPCIPCVHQSYEFQCPTQTNCGLALTPHLVWEKSNSFLRRVL